jgi:hypothetical protein
MGTMLPNFAAFAASLSSASLIFLQANKSL